MNKLVPLIPGEPWQKRKSDLSGRWGSRLIILFSAIAYSPGYCKIPMEYYNSNVFMLVEKTQIFIGNPNGSGKQFLLCV